MSKIYIIMVDFQIMKVFLLTIPFCPGLPYKSRDSAIFRLSKIS